MKTRLLSQPGKAAAGGAVCLAVLAGMMIVHAWPLWSGQVVSVPITVSATRDAFRGEGIAIDHPARHLIVGDPARTVAAAGAVVVQPRGDWWATVPVDPGARRRAMFGRLVYVQLEPGAGSEYRPVSISDAPVAGALNLKGRVRRVAAGGVLDVAYGIDSYFMEEGRAKQIAESLKQSKGGHAQMQVAIARSGRARIKALWIDGKEM